MNYVLRQALHNNLYNDIFSKMTVLTVESSDCDPPTTRDLAYLFLHRVSLLNAKKQNYSP